MNRIQYGKRNETGMKNRRRQFLFLACVFGGSSVALGAFAAHGLKSRLAPELLNAFEAGVRYQMVHALALLAIGAADASLGSNRWASAACWTWSLGIVLFSGSLYLLAMTGIAGLGAITPIGGAAFILGWSLMALAVIKSRSE
jgi:uncharacterized membrane protein YgdD (TMEM256/DUF423 family)